MGKLRWYSFRFRDAYGNTVRIPVYYAESLYDARKMAIKDANEQGIHSLVSYHDDHKKQDGAPQDGYFY